LTLIAVLVAVALGVLAWYANQEKLAAQNARDEAKKAQTQAQDARDEAKTAQMQAQSSYLSAGALLAAYAPNAYSGYADRADLLRIAWHLGNRHLPLQVAGERLRIRADHVIAEMVTGLGGRITPVEAAFDPETGAYAGAAHPHADE